MSTPACPACGYPLAIYEQDRVIQLSCVCGEDGADAVLQARAKAWLEDYANG